jgi:hypothetical protein
MYNNSFQYYYNKINDSKKYDENIYQCVIAVNNDDTDISDYTITPLKI